MDIIKFAVRSVMRGEVHLFSHRFSVHMQLIHGHPARVGGPEVETPAYEQTVVTKSDLAHLPRSLAAKMKRRFKHKHRRNEEDAALDPKMSAAVATSKLEMQER